MNNKSSLEEHIKGLFDQYEPEVPERVWNRIQEEQDRRPVGFFFGWRKVAGWFFIVCCIGGIAGYWALRSEHIVNRSSKKEASSVSHNSTLSGTSKPIISLVSKQSKANKENNDFVSKKQSVSIEPKAISNSDPTTSNATDQRSKDSFTDDQTTGDAVTITKSVNSRKSVKQQSAMPEEYTFNDAQAILVTNDESVEELSAPSATILPKQTTGIRLLANLSTKQYPTITIPCPTAPNPAANRAHVEVHGGPDYIVRQFSDTNTNYAMMRKQSTEFRYAYSAGIRYGRVFNNGLLLKTGLNYSLVTEKFDFIQGNIINVIYVTDAAGDTIGSYQTISARHKITYNKYRTIDVPLLVGYEKAKGRWNFSFNGGLVINLYSWSKGEVLDRSLQPISINSGETPNPYQLKTNIGMGVQAGAGVFYGIVSGCSLFAEPYFRYNFSSMTQSEILLKQRFHTAGIRFGMRVDFDKK